MSKTLTRPPLASRPAPTVDAPSASQPPADDPGARSLCLGDSRAVQSQPGALLAVREVLDFPLLYLASLPAPWSLSLNQLDGAPLTITSSPKVYSAIVKTGGDVVNARWLWPITLAAEHGRGNRVTLTHWLAHVRSDPGWLLTPQYAFEGVCGRFDPRWWTTRRVCLAYGLRLLDVS